MTGGQLGQLAKTHAHSCVCGCVRCLRGCRVGCFGVGLQGLVSLHLPKAFSVVQLINALFIAVTTQPIELVNTSSGWVFFWPCRCCLFGHFLLQQEVGAG